MNIGWLYDIPFMYIEIEDGFWSAGGQGVGGGTRQV